VRLAGEKAKLGSVWPHKGTDFVARDRDRIKSVVGFLDHVPAGA